MEAFERKVADNPNDLDSRERLPGRPEAGFHKGIETERYAEARALWLRQARP